MRFSTFSIAFLLLMPALACFRDPNIDVGQPRHCQADNSCPWGYICGPTGFCCNSSNGKACDVGFLPGDANSQGSDTAVNLARTDVAMDLPASETTNSSGGVAGGTGGSAGAGGTIDARGVGGQDTAIDAEVDAPLGGIGGLSGSGGSTVSSGGSGGAVSGSGGMLGTGGTGGSTATGGAPGTGGTGGHLKSTGEPCAADVECAKGVCADSVCCDKVCSGCSACTHALTGAADGTCASVSNGLDPHHNCGTTCNDGNLTILACNGSDACAAQSNGACPGNVQCANASVCLGTACSNDTQCADGYRCSSNTCVLKKVPGSACSADGECSTGHCVDGHCCGTASCDGCQACTGSGGTCVAATARNGSTCGTNANMYCYNGTCSSCTPNVACNTTSLCETWQTSCSTGASVCTKVGNRVIGSSCGGGQTCSASTKYTAYTCDGSGSCSGGVPSNCTYGCSGNDCAAGWPNDHACTYSSECLSGHCKFVAVGKICAANCGTAVDPCCEQSECPANKWCDVSYGSCNDCGLLGQSCCPNANPPCVQTATTLQMCTNNGQPNLPLGYCTICGYSGGPCCTGSRSCLDGSACLSSNNCP